MNIKYKIRRFIDKITKRDKTYKSIISDNAPWVYISYIPEVFYKQKNLRYMNGHQSRRETIEMVRCFNNLGYNVFMTHFNNPTFPNVDVKIIFGLEPVFTEACRIYSDAKKIYYATGAYYGHQNSMIESRTNYFNIKHAANCPLLRLVKEDERIELADKILQIGSKYTIQTYPEKYREKITTIHQSCSIVNCITMEQHGNDYMWIGGGGAILKGLDLVIDYFVCHKDMTLHVIGNIENDFLEAYSSIDLSNVIFYGHMDTASEEFRKVIAKCSFMVYPSCTEGGLPGSVITSMYYGLIPIVSKWAAFDEIESYGYVINELQDIDIERAIEWSLALDSNYKRSLSLKCSKFAQQTYNIDNFKKELYKYFENII